MEIVEIDGLKVAMLRGGRGPIGLLFIHGIRNASWVWNPTLDLLDPERFSWMAFDLPGCGESDDPVDWSGATVSATAVLVNALAGRCFDSMPVLIGHSLGAAIAVEATLSFGCATAVVLVAPSPLGGLSVALDQVLSGAFAAESDVEALGRAAFSTQPSEADFQRLVRTVVSARRAHTEGALRSVHGLDLRSKLLDLDVPSMVLGGDEDRHVSPREMYLTASALRRPKVQIWTGVGHVPHWERPDEFSNLVSQFAAAASGPGKEPGLNN